MGADQLVQSWLTAGLLVIGLLVLWVLRSRRNLSAFLVGATGALMDAQVERVHLFTLAAVLWVLTTTASGAARWARVLILLGAAGTLATTVLFGDLVNSRTLALQLMGLSATAAAICMRATSDDVRAMLRGALVAITCGAGLAMLQVARVLPVELLHQDVSSLGRPIGIWPEPDWLGLMAALGLILAWRLSLSPVVRTVALSLNGLAFVLAFARAAWLALAISVVVVAVVRRLGARDVERHPGRARAAAVLVLVAVVLLLAVPGLRSDLGRRVETLVSSADEDVSGQARLQQTGALLFLAESAAPFGHGLSASGRVGVSGDLLLGVQSPNNVGSNWVLSFWVDGALLAVPLMLFLLVVSIRGAPFVSGQMLLVVLANSLFSNAVFFPVTWLCLGLTMQALPLPPRLQELFQREGVGAAGATASTSPRMPEPARPES